MIRKSSWAAWTRRRRDFFTDYDLIYVQESRELDESVDSRGPRNGSNIGGW
jgi:hypothetical protein